MPEDITPEWLTSVLHRNGIARETAVSAVNVLLAKELPISTVYRLSLGYKETADQANHPGSVFLKLCGPSSLGKAPEGIGLKEVEFYRAVAPEMHCPPLVRCYDAAHSKESGHSHILMEDLFETHSQPEQNMAPIEQQSRLAVEALAKMHAYWWNSPRLGQDVGTLFDDKTLREFIENLNSSVAAFLQFADDDLTLKQKEAYRRMLGSAEQIWGRLRNASDLTVTHGDMHWWNFLYPKDPESGSIHIFDWHLWHIDLGARDLAFLLALGGFAEPRPELEEALLRAYLETLAANGVSNYTWDELWSDYRLSSIRNLNIPVIFWQQGKHESTWKTALRRSFDSYERLIIPAR
jgi:thiamine kinase-like enzyme